MNENYKILGKIISILNKDYPPRVSKKFTYRVMSGITNNKIKKVLIYPTKSKAMNLAFDVTPAKYVTGLITERGISEASSEGLKKLFK